MALTSRSHRPGSRNNHGRRRLIDLTAINRNETSETDGKQVDFTEDDARPLPAQVRPPLARGADLDEILDGFIKLSARWEKILSLLALVTTNLSGNKSLGALLEILAKDKLNVNVSDAVGNKDAQAPNGVGNLNIGELINMAEALLKSSQPPPEAAPQANPPIEAETIVVEENPAVGHDPETELEGVQADKVQPELDDQVEDVKTEIEQEEAV